jgi:hypothetical protein
LQQRVGPSSLIVVVWPIRYSAHKMRRLLALLLVVTITAGCEGFDVLSPQRTGALIRTIEIGMTEAEVVNHLGKPQKEETRGDTKFLFYATPWQVAEKAKERSPIAIRDGKVVGVGIAYLGKLAPPRPWDAWLVQVRPEEEERVRYSTTFAIGQPND